MQHTRIYDHCGNHNYHSPLGLITKLEAAVVQQCATLHIVCFFFLLIKELRINAVYFMAAPFPLMQKNILQNHIIIRTRQTIRLDSLSGCCYLRVLHRRKEKLVYIPVHKKYSRDREEKNWDQWTKGGDMRRRKDEKGWGGQNRIQTSLIKQLSYTQEYMRYTQSIHNNLLSRDV